MINKVILIGNLGQDPDLRSTASGATVANLRIATTERRKDRDGNWGDHTEWHSVVSFGRTAENDGKYCRKGKQIYIEGRLQTRKWQDRDGRCSGGSTRATPDFDELTRTTFGHSSGNQF